MLIALQEHPEPARWEPARPAAAGGDMSRQQSADTPSAPPISLKVRQLLPAAVWPVRPASQATAWRVAASPSESGGAVCLQTMLRCCTQVLARPKGCLDGLHTAEPKSLPVVCDGDCQVAFRRPESFSGQAVNPATPFYPLQPAAALPVLGPDRALFLPVRADGSRELWPVAIATERCGPSRITVKSGQRAWWPPR